MIPPVWRRRHPARADRSFEVGWYVFSHGSGERGGLPASRFGLPEGGLHGVELRRHARAEDPAWFDGFRSGSLGAAADAQLRDRGALDRADVCHSVRARGPDPAHLGHAQAALAVVRWLLATGGDVALDGAAIRFWERLPPPTAHPVIREWVSLIVETEPTLGDDGFLLHTRGLRSFGRPDLVTVAHATDADALAPVLLQLAAALADGWMPDGPTEVEVQAGEIITVHPDPGLPFVARLQLGNDALVLTDRRGDALVGFAQRVGRTGLA